MMVGRIQFGWPLALIVISMMLSGCLDRILNNSRPPDFYLYIKVVNVQGQDMLDPVTPDYIPKSNIHLYYVINGVKIPCEQTGSGEPASGFTSNKGLTRDPFYALEVRSNYSIQDNEAVTLLEFVNKQTDTLRCHFTKYTKKGNVARDSIYLNSVFIQGPYKDEIEPFKIVIR
ncbi:MAG TPA: hypothetical protein VFE57_08250 [Cyclobacteriaceae bacterium]|nr:hypothetical protein [Cyclobacteriaceae bacterium]